MGNNKDDPELPGGLIAITVTHVVSAGKYWISEPPGVEMSEQRNVLRKLELKLAQRMSGERGIPQDLAANKLIAVKNEATGCWHRGELLSLPPESLLSRVRVFLIDHGAFLVNVRPHHVQTLPEEMHDLPPQAFIFCLYGLIPLTMNVHLEIPMDKFHHERGSCWTPAGEIFVQDLLRQSSSAYVKSLVCKGKTVHGEIFLNIPVRGLISLNRELCDKNYAFFSEKEYEKVIEHEEKVEREMVERKALLMEAEKDKRLIESQATMKIKCKLMDDFIKEYASRILKRQEQGFHKLDSIRKDVDMKGLLAIDDRKREELKAEILLSGNRSAGRASSLIEIKEHIANIPKGRGLPNQVKRNSSSSIGNSSRKTEESLLELLDLMSSKSKREVHSFQDKHVSIDVDSVDRIPAGFPLEIKQGDKNKKSKGGSKRSTIRIHPRKSSLTSDRIKEQVDERHADALLKCGSSSRDVSEVTVGRDSARRLHNHIFMNPSKINTVEPERSCSGLKEESHVLDNHIKYSKLLTGGKISEIKSMPPKKPLVMADYEEVKTAMDSCSAKHGIQVNRSCDDKMGSMVLGSHKNGKQNESENEMADAQQCILERQSDDDQGSYMSSKTIEKIQRLVKLQTRCNELSPGDTKSPSRSKLFDSCGESSKDVPSKHKREKNTNLLSSLLEMVKKKGPKKEIGEHIDTDKPCSVDGNEKPIGAITDLELEDGTSPSVCRRVTRSSLFEEFIKGKTSMTEHVGSVELESAAFQNHTFISINKGIMEENPVEDEQGHISATPCVAVTETAVNFMSRNILKDDTSIHIARKEANKTVSSFGLPVDTNSGKNAFGTHDASKDINEVPVSPDLKKLGEELRAGNRAISGNAHLLLNDTQDSEALPIHGKLNGNHTSLKQSNIAPGDGLSVHLEKVAELKTVEKHPNIQPTCKDVLEISTKSLEFETKAPIPNSIERLFKLFSLKKHPGESSSLTRDVNIVSMPKTMVDTGVQVNVDIGDSRDQVENPNCCKSEDERSSVLVDDGKKTESSESKNSEQYEATDVVARENLMETLNDIESSLHNSHDKEVNSMEESDSTFVEVNKCLDVEDKVCNDVDSISKEMQSLAESLSKLEVEKNSLVYDAMKNKGVSLDCLSVRVPLGAIQASMECDKSLRSSSHSNSSVVKVMKETTALEEKAKEVDLQKILEPEIVDPSKDSRNSRLPPLMKMSWLSGTLEERDCLLSAHRLKMCRVLVRGKLMCQPIQSIAQVPFKESLHKRLLMEGYRDPMRIQTYVWPALMRGHNVIMINPPRSGKTLGYLVPIMSFMLSPDLYSELPRGNGPLVLILCPSWKIVYDINHTCQWLLQNAEKPVRVIPVYGGLETEQTIPLTNGCEILITTPRCLLRLLEGNRLITNLDRMCHLVFDEADTLMKKFLPEIKEILRECRVVLQKRARAAAECNPSGDSDSYRMIKQVAAAKSWSPQMESFVTNIVEKPLLCIGSYLEAAVYACLKPTLHVVGFQNLRNDTEVTPSLSQDKKDEMDSIVLGIIKANLGLRKFVVACDKADAIQRLAPKIRDLGANLLVVHEGKHHTDIAETRHVWQCSQISGALPVLMISDDTLSEFNIGNAEHLIHVGVPSTSKTQFGLRFSVLMDNYRDVFDKASKVNNCSVDIVLDITDPQVELSGLIEFLQRVGMTIPRELEAIASKIHLHKEMMSKKDVELCAQVKSFGECHLTACKSRHAVLPEIDKPEEGMPLSGEIRVKILNVLDASHITARLLEHTKPDGTKVLFPDDYFRIASGLASHFHNPNAASLHGHTVVGDLCAYQAEHNLFLRARVEAILESKHENKTPVTVSINLIDEGIRKIVKVYQLLYLPDHLKTYPAQAKDLIVCRMMPMDLDLSWSKASCFRVAEMLDKASKEEIDGIDIIGVVVLTLGNTIWVDPLECRQYLEKQKTSVIHTAVRLDLLQSRLAVNNPSHIEKLRKLCEVAGLPFPSKESLQLSDKIDSKENLDKSDNVEEESPCEELPVLPTWESMTTENLIEVNVVAVDSPFCFRVNKISNSEEFEALSSDIQAWVSTVGQSSPSEMESHPEYALGTICLGFCSVEDSWNRAKVVEIIKSSLSIPADSSDVVVEGNSCPMEEESEQYKLYFVDYGDMAVVSASQIAPIPSHFISQLPFQAIECSLLGVKPISSKSTDDETSENWEEESSNAFFRHCREKDDVDIYRPMLSKVFGTEGGGTYGGTKYLVTLYDKGDREVVNVGKVLVEEGFAAPCQVVVDGEADDEMDDELQSHWIGEGALLPFTPAAAIDANNEKNKLEDSTSSIVEGTTCTTLVPVERGVELEECGNATALSQTDDDSESFEIVMSDDEIHMYEERLRAFLGIPPRPKHVNENREMHPLVESMNERAALKQILPANPDDISSSLASFEVIANSSSRSSGEFVELPNETNFVKTSATRAETCALSSRKLLTKESESVLLKTDNDSNVSNIKDANDDKVPWVADRLENSSDSLKQTENERTNAQHIQTAHATSKIMDTVETDQPSSGIVNERISFKIIPPSEENDANSENKGKSSAGASAELSDEACFGDNSKIGPVSLAHISSESLSKEEEFKCEKTGGDSSESTVVEMNDLKLPQAEEELENTPESLKETRTENQITDAQLITSVLATGEITGTIETDRRASGVTNKESSLKQISLSDGDDESKELSTVSCADGSVESSAKESDFLSVGKCHDNQAVCVLKIGDAESPINEENFENPQDSKESECLEKSIIEALVVPNVCATDDNICSNECATECRPTEFVGITVLGTNASDKISNEDSNENGVTEAVIKDLREGAGGSNFDGNSSEESYDEDAFNEIPPLVSAKTPLVKWAQNKWEIILTIEMANIKYYSIHWESNKELYVHTTSGFVNGSYYTLALNLWAPINTESVEQVPASDNVLKLILPKALTCIDWPRLLHETTRQPWLSVDFDCMDFEVDEDRDDFSKEVINFKQSDDESDSDDAEPESEKRFEEINYDPYDPLP